MTRENNPLSSRRAALAYRSDGPEFHRGYGSLDARVIAGPRPNHPSRPSSSPEGKPGSVSLYAGWAVAFGFIRSQARTTNGAIDVGRRSSVAFALSIPSAWGIGVVVVGIASASREACRRSMRDSQYAHRSAEPPAGIRANAHRQFPVRPTLAGGLDAVWTGKCERESAGICHD